MSVTLMCRAGPASAMKDEPVEASGNPQAGACAYGSAARMGDSGSHRRDCAICKIGAVGENAQNEIIESDGQVRALAAHAFKIGAS